MAVKVRAEVTLSAVVDVSATYRYYKLQSSTLTAPAKPTTRVPPAGWDDTEQTYTAGSTMSLYTVDLTVFSDSTWAYSAVSLSTSYEAAKAAYNKSLAAEATANSKTTAFYQASAPPVTGRKVNDIWFDTDDGNKMYYWDGTTWTAKQFNTNAIAAKAITASLIAADAVTADKIIADAITTAKIASGAVTANELAANAVTAGKIAAGAVTAEKITVESLQAICAKIGGFSIGSTYIANGTSVLAGAANSVYVGTNGISCGKAFKALPTGQVDMTNANITGGTLDIRGNAAGNPNYQGFVKILNGQLLVGYDATAEGGPVRNIVELMDEGIRFWDPYNATGTPRYLTYENVPRGNRVLWQGGHHMTASHTINLEEAVSNQATGIVLVFSAYSGGAKDYDWHCFFVPKIMVELHNGVGHTFNMSGSKHVRDATKYLYISDTKITGNDDNTATGTGSSITYANDTYVMRYVIGV